MVDTTMLTYPRPLYGASAATDPYGAYAAVYDLQGQSRWSERMVAFLDYLMPRYDVTPRRVLAHASGTGAPPPRVAPPP
jgi:hypothetical protein